MKNLASLLMMFGLGLFAVGCSEEQQLQNAQEDLQEERFETIETINDATADGIVTSDERADIIEEQGETAEQAGETAKQASDVIADDIDN